MNIPCWGDGGRGGGSGTMGLWSRVVPVITTRLSLLSSSLSWGSTGLKKKDLFHVSTRESMAGITSFSTCTVASTWDHKEGQSMQEVLTVGLSSLRACNNSDLSVVVHLLHSTDQATHHSLFPVSWQRACERHLRDLCAMDPVCKRKSGRAVRHAQQISNHVKASTKVWLEGLFFLPGTIPIRPAFIWARPARHE